MKILLLNPLGLIGGAERALLDCIAGLRRTSRPPEIHLVCCTPGPLLTRAEELGATVHLLEMPATLASMGESDGRKSVLCLLKSGVLGGGDLLRYVHSLRALVRRIEPDLIHSNGIKTHLLASLLGSNAPPVVWHLHDFLGHRRLMSRVLSVASRRAAMGLAVSSAVREDASSLLRRTPVRLLLNAVNVDHFCPSQADPAELDRLAGLPAPSAPTLRVALVATYARWKGQDVFLQAARKLTEQRRDIRFYIVGGPIYRTTGSQFSRQELQRLTESLGVVSQVGFIDFVDDPRAIYRAADICIHASTRPEPFGLTILEAMACGRPVICADGAAELVEHGVNGLRTPPGDWIALAKAISRLADDATLRKSLACQARQWAVQRFSRARLGPELLGLYEQVLQARASRSIDLLEEEAQMLTDPR